MSVFIQLNGATYTHYRKVPEAPSRFFILTGKTGQNNRQLPPLQQVDGIPVMQIFPPPLFCYTLYMCPDRAKPFLNQGIKKSTQNAAAHANLAFYLQTVTDLGQVS